MAEATPEQEAWTKGYDACRQHVGQQRLPQVYEALDTAVEVGTITPAAATHLKVQIVTIFSDLGFPFAGPDRITDPAPIHVACMSCGWTGRHQHGPIQGARCPSCNSGPIVRHDPRPTTNTGG
jgi:hypothetical protein